MQQELFECLRKPTMFRGGKINHSEEIVIPFAATKSDYQSAHELCKVFLEFYLIKQIFSILIFNKSSLICVVLMVQATLTTTTVVAAATKIIIRTIQTKLMKVN
uniref:Uncharacterized protein n=1 Tax=Glossina brevipalpis TaxID=37001 RepID=A0A1A9W4P1_9MUSC